MTTGLQVIFIEDDELVRRASVQSLQLAGFEVAGHGSVEAASRSIDASFPGVIVSDIRLPGASGLDLLAQCRERAPEVPIILVTGHGDISMAVQAMRDGAYDFIEKPFASERLIEAVRRALERRKLVLENQALRRELAGQSSVAPRIIGRSPAIEQVRRLIANVAPTDASVLINGDTGAGKELIARSLHDLSPRRDKPFIAVNCGALPEQMFESEMFGYEAGAFTGAQKRRVGKLEHASGGTLFLDEIESMPLSLQVKLLRVLQDGVLERLGSNQPIRANCRVVAAAKGDMAEHVADGTFRRDLLYRLNVVTITLPPLRGASRGYRAAVRAFPARCRRALRASRADADRPPAGAIDAARLAGQRARVAQRGGPDGARRDRRHGGPARCRNAVAEGAHGTVRAGGDCGGAGAVRRSGCCGGGSAAVGEGDAVREDQAVWAGGEGGG